jgi:hypothetical protein
MPARSGRYPSGQRGQTVNLLAYAFGGSNPPLPTIVASAVWTDRVVGGLLEVRVALTRATAGRRTDVRGRPGATCGNSSAVERQPSKLGVAGSNPVSRSTDIEHRHGSAEPGAGGWKCRGDVGVPTNTDNEHRHGSAEPGASEWGCGGHVEAPTSTDIERAHVAQLAERVLGKDEVSGSNPDMGSSFQAAVSAAVNGR